ncbi:hypothetical protein AGMMS49545_14540 [Betaproteobacteria bacterium]|nr:hypothetical protein AGMMS49545_14540 [Betaproteobacteria bacterium]GHU41592.1 hypothetical protein AGMMS50289_04980 [Betaproteobacteria bacterium]
MHARAFTVSRLTQADILKVLHDGIAAVVSDKLKALPAQIGAALAVAVEKGAPDVAREMDAAFAEFFDRAYANRARPQGEMMVVGAMKTQWVDGRALPR